MAAKKKEPVPVPLVNGELTAKQAAQEAIKCLQFYLHNRENPEAYRKQFGNDATWRSAFEAAESLCEAFSKEPTNV